MAELAGLPIPSMDWHSPDAPQAFKKFKARCELYFSGPLKEKSEEVFPSSVPGDCCVFKFLKSGRGVKP